MKLTNTIIAGVSVFAAVVKAGRSNNAAADCEVTKGVTLSFYGKGDISGPLAYSECGRINAGGRGSYDSPLSMAGAPGAFSKCEIIFVPYLLKYVRFEDVCTDCVTDWANGKMHMQIWTGNERSGGREQSDCERDLAPTHGMTVIRNPGSDYRLDTTPLYDRSATSPCRMGHRYSLLNNEVFCYGRRDKTAGRRRKKNKSKQTVMQRPEKPEDEVAVEEPKAVPAPAIPAAAAALKAAKVDAVAPAKAAKVAEAAIPAGKVINPGAVDALPAAKVVKVADDTLPAAKAAKVADDALPAAKSVKVADDDAAPIVQAGKAVDAAVPKAGTAVQVPAAAAPDSNAGTAVRIPVAAAPLSNAGSAVQIPADVVPAAKAANVVPVAKAETAVEGAAAADIPPRKAAKAAAADAALPAAKVAKASEADALPAAKPAQIADVNTPPVVKAVEGDADDFPAAKAAKVARDAVDGGAGAFAANGLNTKITGRRAMLVR